MRKRAFGMGFLFFALAVFGPGLAMQAHANTTLYYTGNPFDDPNAFCLNASGGSCPCPPSQVTLSVTFDSSVTPGYSGVVDFGNGVVSSTATAFGVTITGNTTTNFSYCYVYFNNGQIYEWDISLTSDSGVNVGSFISTAAGPKPLSALDSASVTWTNSITWDNDDNANQPGTWSSIPPGPTGPVASFTAEPTDGKAPLKVYFANRSVGDFTKCLWNFGDGGTSKIWNPSHTYKKAGTYTVTLTMTGSTGTCTCSQLSLITADTAPKAKFSATPRSGDFPLTVNFTNDSTGVITSWLWNFGDGTTSTEPNPAHTYESPRTYKARLTVYGPGGSSSKTGSIRVEK